MHFDYQTDSKQTHYYFIGDGRLLCVIQHSTNKECSPIGVILQEPERRSRKHSSLLFHPEFGLQKTMLSVFANGKRYSPKHGQTSVKWSSEKACIHVFWHEDNLVVEEKFMVINSCLFRSVNVKFTQNSHTNNPDEPSDGIQVLASFYANPSLFNDFSTKPDGSLKATGYAHLALHCQSQQATAFERFITLDTTTNQTHTFVYSLNNYRLLGHESEILKKNFPLDSPEPQNCLGKQISNLYRVAKIGLRSVISKTGSFDASVWQYGMEWGLDAAYVTKAAILCGESQLAHELMNNLFGRLVSDNGEVMESSRFRDGAESELNGNGAVLEAAYFYLLYSQDKNLISPFWDKIKKVADYILQDSFAHSSGLLITHRDFWERLSWMGVEVGFELGQQVLCGIGLNYASVIATLLLHKKEATKWQKKSEKIIQAMLSNHKFSLIENNTFIYRRLLNGKPQFFLTPAPTGNQKYKPYFFGNNFDSTPLPCSPDITSVLPIIYNLAPENTLKNTLHSIAQLWDTNGLGGYARCPNPSDPDSKGAWTFGNCFALQAQINAQDFENATKTLKWLIAQAGEFGNWFEFYGVKKSPPLPPNGIIVWGWAQWIIAVIENICGLKISENEITIAPVVSNLDITTRIGHFTLRIVTNKLSEGLANERLVTPSSFSKVKINGAYLPSTSVRLSLPFESDFEVEFF